MEQVDVEVYNEPRYIPHGYSFQNASLYAEALRHFQRGRRLARTSHQRLSEETTYPNASAAGRVVVPALTACATLQGTACFEFEGCKWTSVGHGRPAGSAQDWARALAGLAPQCSATGSDRHNYSADWDVPTPLNRCCCLGIHLTVIQSRDRMT